MVLVQAGRSTTYIMVGFFVAYSYVVAYIMVLVMSCEVVARIKSKRNMGLPKIG